jgi:N-acylneuraminate cytidylyltransferase
MKIAIIPARGGSKRIPRKNIKDFFGKPIIAYSIEAAINSALFDEVMVSTDDEEIAEIAIKYGANVPFFRSEENSDDLATTSDVLLEVIEYYQHKNQKLETILCLYPTAPLINEQDLIASHKIWAKGEFDVLLSSVAFDFAVQRGFKISMNNSIELIQPEAIHKRSQDLETIYHDAGIFYWLNSQTFKENKTIWAGRIGTFVMDQMKVQDIDTPEDWEIAKLKYEHLQSAE